MQDCTFCRCISVVTAAASKKKLLSYISWGGQPIATKSFVLKASLDLLSNACFSSIPRSAAAVASLRILLKFLPDLSEQKLAFSLALSHSMLWELEGLNAWQTVVFSWFPQVLDKIKKKTVLRFCLTCITFSHIGKKGRYPNDTQKMALESAPASCCYCCSVPWPSNQARKKNKTHIFDQINPNPHQQPIV